MTHKKSTGSFIFMIGLIGCYSSLSAQGKLNLSIDQAIELALKNNKQYKQAEAEVEKSGYQINEAWGYAMPTIRGNIQFTHNIEIPTTYLPAIFFNSSAPPSLLVPIKFGFDNAMTASLNVNQTLFSKTVGTALEVAEIYNDFSNEGLKTSKLTTIFNTKKAYYGARLAQNFYEDAKKIYSLTEANFKNIHEMFLNGMASEFDDLRLSVQLSNTAPKVLQAENAFKIALTNLKNTIGLDDSTSINLTEEFKFQKLSTEQLNNETATAIENNPALRQLTIQKDLLGKQLEITQAEFWPTLSLTGGMTYSSNANDFKVSNYQWNRSSNVGLQLSIPIFNGLQTVWKAEQNKVDVRKLEYQISYLKDNIKLSAEQSILKLNEAKKRVDAQEKSVAQAEKALSIAEARFKNGVGLQLEILDAQVALSQTLTNRSQAIYDYLMAKAEWEQAVGLE